MWRPEVEGRPGPRYRAIADALARDVARGRLAPGMRLPTHRALADQLGVTVGTVTRAYAEAARRGLLSGEVGRGSFIRSAPTPLSHLLPPGTAGVVNLSVNHPPVTARDRAALKASLAALARRADVADLLFGYQPEAGLPRHRQAAAGWISRTGLAARPEDVVVCAGGQHAMTVTLATLLEPGDLLLTESLTYPGVKTLAGLLRLRLHGVPIDEHGLRPDALETVLRAGSARALYCLPTFHNPTTALMPEARRAEIAELCRRYGVPIVEDDVPGPLPLERPRPLVTFAPEIGYYVTTTSKCLAPGLRVAYVLAPPGGADRIAAALRATTWMAAPLGVEIATRWMEDGTADALLDARRQEARARHELARRLLGRLEYRAHPDAYHVWLTLPDPWPSAAFAARARQSGVAIAPADVFMVGRGAPPHAVRISLGGPPRDTLERALRVLLTVLAGPPDAGLAIV
jgi:DNA-binding transcriptional MocR family regulator